MQETVGINDGGTLHFEYEWESSTGDLSDLSNCVVGEWVDYDSEDNPYCFPSPWVHCVGNPTINTHPATWGGLQDNHSPGYVSSPYQEAQVIASQRYWYRCGVPCCMSEDDYETLLNIGAIIRKITQEVGIWKYWITKSGVYAEILLYP